MSGHEKNGWWNDWFEGVPPLWIAFLFKRSFFFLIEKTLLKTKTGKKQNSNGTAIILLTASSKVTFTIANGLFPKSKDSKIELSIDHLAKEWAALFAMLVKDSYQIFANVLINHRFVLKNNLVSTLPYPFNYQSTKLAHKYQWWSSWAY